MDNIFTALMRRKDSGVIREFVLWCILCVDIVLFMAAALVDWSKVTWVMLMVFTVGMAVIAAFRLKAIALLYSIGVFHLLAVTMHYICYRPGNAALALLLFVLLLLLAVASLTCSFVHNFSRYNLDRAVMAMVITGSAFIMILQILMYVQRGAWRSWAGYGGYWLGTISFWILLVAVDLYHVFFVMGLIDNRKKKIIQMGQASRQPVSRSITPVPQGPGYGVSIGIQGISGTYTGRAFYLQNGELIIGSDRGAGAAVLLPDAYISRWHCAIRYNQRDGYYEVYDRSMNGVYLSNGNRLPRDVWNKLPRGGIICIGGMKQQFRLL